MCIKCYVHFCTTVYTYQANSCTMRFQLVAATLSALLVSVVTMRISSGFYHNKILIH